MRKVLRIMVRRTVNAAITIFGILCLNYVLIRLMPGNAEANLAPHNPQYAGYLADNIRTFGLDRSPEEQFVIYLQNAFTFNWGISYYWKQPVADLLLHDLSWTLLLVGTSTIFTTLIGMVVGSFAAVRRGKPFDLISTGSGDDGMTGCLCLSYHSVNLSPHEKPWCKTNNVSASLGAPSTRFTWGTWTSSSGAATYSTG